MALVLVVEDNPANMKLAVFLMKVHGHEVLQAVDAEAGIALARERHPFLILMDIQLPGMDGLAATQLLKSEAATSDIKIVALTALAMSGDRQKIEAAGCDGYLAKPIRYHELYKLVGNIMKS
jgi:two-component system cell cycle response regulator DivK